MTLYETDQRRDSWYRFRNGLMRLAYNNFGPVWRTIQAVPPVARRVNRALINQGVNAVPPRP
jgi:hypothetical protein